MSELAADSRLSLEEARDLTEEVKADAAALWSKLLSLYEGEAHLALGYSSWGEYYEEEFGGSASRGKHLLAAARVVRVLEESGSNLNPPGTDSVARELSPVLREAPEQVEEVWGEVVELHGPAPTAKQVREVVDEKRNDRLAVHFSSATDEWATPADFFECVAAEFEFELDVCALPTSAKCERYFGPEDDGLEQDWSGTCWMNPPYGNEIAAWVRKAYESAQAGATVVCLVPARTDTNWWHDYCGKGEVRFIKGRLRFGEATASAPFPNALVVFGRDPQMFNWEWR